MNKVLMRCIKYLAMVALFTLFVPAVAICAFFSYAGTDTAHVYGYTATIAAVGFFGYFVAFAANYYRKRLSAVAINIIKLSLGIAAAVVLLLIFARENVTAAVFFAALGGAAFFLGGRSFPAAYYEIITVNRFFMTIVLNLSAVFLVWSFSNILVMDYARPALAPPFLFFTVIYYLTLNQSNIDNLMRRRRHSLAHLPQKIRYYNIFLTLAVLAIVICGYVFRDKLADFLRYVVSLLGNLVRYFLRGREQSFDFSRGGKIQAPPSPLTSEVRFPIEVVYVALGILVLAGLIYYRTEILQFLRECGQKLWAFIKRLLLRFTRFRILTNTSEDYVDTIETLTSRSGEVKAEERVETSHKSWKKAHRSFLRMADSPTKLRFGYRLLLDGLALMGVEIAQSDTTLEILQKAVASVSALSVPAYASATVCYNNIRYGDCPLGAGDIGYMTDTLSALAGAISGG